MDPTNPSMPLSNFTASPPPSPPMGARAPSLQHPTFHEVVRLLMHVHNQQVADLHGQLSDVSMAGAPNMVTNLHAENMQLKQQLQSLAQQNSALLRRGVLQAEKIRELGAKTANLDKLIKEKDAEILTCRTTLCSQTNANQCYQAKIAAQTAKIKKQAASMRELDLNAKMVEARAAKAKEQDAKIARQATKIKEQAARIKEQAANGCALENRVKQLTNSLSSAKQQHRANGDHHKTVIADLTVRLNQTKQELENLVVDTVSTEIYQEYMEKLQLQTETLEDSQKRVRYLEYRETENQKTMKELEEEYRKQCRNLGFHNGQLVSQLRRKTVALDTLSGKIKTLVTVVRPALHAFGVQLDDDLKLSSLLLHLICLIQKFAGQLSSEQSQALAKATQKTTEVLTIETQVIRQEEPPTSMDKLNVDDLNVVGHVDLESPGKPLGDDDPIRMSSAEFMEIHRQNPGLLKRILSQ
jgi:DNA repair exonuclease SbcCD ATPase subunit